MDKYIIIAPIGEGSFAKVYRGREKFTGRVRRMIFFFVIEFQIVSCLGRRLKIHFEIG